MWKKVKASNLFVCLFAVFLCGVLVLRSSWKPFFLRERKAGFFLGAGGGFCFSEEGGDGVSYGMESP